MPYERSGVKEKTVPKRVSRGDARFKGREIQLVAGGQTESIPVPDEELYCDRCGVLIDTDELWLLDDNALCNTCKGDWDIRNGVVRAPLNMEWAGTSQVGLLFDFGVLSIAGSADGAQKRAIDTFIRLAGEYLRGCFVLVGDWVGSGEFEEGALCVSALLSSEEAMELIADVLDDVLEGDVGPEIVRALGADDLHRQSLKPVLWIRADATRVEVAMGGEWPPQAKDLWLQLMHGGKPAN